MTIEPESLRAQRVMLGLTQARLARSLGVTANTIARWERGVAPIGNPELIQLALERLATSRGSLVGRPAHTRSDRRPPRVRAAGKRGRPRDTHNLPAQVSSFVGRGQEVADVRRLLAGHRLVTLTGTGGVGKTRIALQASLESVESYSGGVWLVELAGLTNPELVPQAAALALGIPEQAGRVMRDTLARALAPRELLLVIDNCEHLLDACADLVQHLLRLCPLVSVLATSRESLGVAGEHVWLVPSLSLPVVDAGSRSPLSMEWAAAAESVRLFIDRVNSVVPNFTLNETNAVSVSNICVRLDGIPLALELAAARANALSVHEIGSRLDDRLGLLSVGNRTAPPRHHTLRAALEWSYGLLNPHEQQFFDRLSVFAGGWTLEAAEAVCTEDEREPGGILDTLTALVSKSLVLVDTRASGVTRYRLLEMLREYGAERLALRGQSDATRDKHALFFLALGERAGPATWGPHAAEWWQRLDEDTHNVRAALRWLVDSGALERAQRLGASMVRFWQTHSNISEGRAWLAELLALPTAQQRTAVHGQLLAGTGHLAGFQRDFPLAQRALLDAVTIAREAGDQLNLAYALFYYGQILWQVGEFAAARETASEGIAVSRAIGNHVLHGQCEYVLGAIHYEFGEYGPARERQQEALRLNTLGGYVRGIGSALQQLGRVAYREGELAKARRLMEDSVTGFRRSAWPYGIAWDFVTLGWIATDQRQLEEARNYLTDALRLFGDIGATGRVVECLEGFAQLGVSEHDFARALRLGGMAEAQREQFGTPLSPGERGALEPRLDRAWAALGAVRADREWTLGRGMSVDEAVAYALQPASIATTGPRRAPKPILTTREAEIATSVASGCTTREIAAQLVIAERTVETHLEHIYSKLEVHSRLQLARWLAQHELSELMPGEASRRKVGRFPDDAQVPRA